MVDEACAVEKDVRSGVLYSAFDAVGVTRIDQSRFDVSVIRGRQIVKSLLADVGGNDMRAVVRPWR